MSIETALRSSGISEDLLELSICKAEFYQKAFFSREFLKD
jgi:hypothetical protein